MNRTEQMVAMRLHGTEEQQTIVEMAVCIFVDEVVEEGIAPVFHEIASGFREPDEGGREAFVRLLRDAMANGTKDQRAFMAEAVSRYVRRQIRNPKLKYYREPAEIIDLFADITAAQDRRPS